MSVRFIIGKPGGGKSLTAVRFLLAELEKDDGKRVVTNLPILIGFVAAYLGGKGKAVNVERLDLVDDDNVKEFYLAAKGRKAHKDRVDNLVIDDRGEGTLFLIDEVHLFFPSRDFRQTGPTLLSYLSQHRKLGDEVILITQHPDQTDKALRRLTEEYLVSVNLSKRRLWGFRGPAGRFLVRTYFEQPSALSKPCETISYSLNTEQAQCYDTSVGVGVTAGISDAGKPSRGISPIWALVSFVALVALLSTGVFLMPKLVTKIVSGAMGAATSAPAVVVPANGLPFGLSIGKVLPLETNVVVTTVGRITSPESYAPQTTAAPDESPAGHVSAVVVPVLPREAPQGALANPSAVASGRRVYAIRGFNGQVWAVRSTAGFDLREEIAKALQEELQAVRDGPPETELPSNR